MTRDFFKMTGSGNDFIFFDARSGTAAGQMPIDAASVPALCARGTGVGADGVVVIGSAQDAHLRMTYFNSDGSRGEMCGNAALCAVSLAARFGVGGPAETRLQTDSGIVTGRLVDGRPEIDLAPVRTVEPATSDTLEPGEQRIGYCDVGVPHLVVLCEDAHSVDVVGRGRPLRQARTRPRGANVNFVSRTTPVGPWTIRTYERGVEGETLACGTGAVAAAILLATWGASGMRTEFVTRSGRELAVRLRRGGGGLWEASLAGEGRLVFTGTLALSE
jgi:diaminopimelate epimerase